MIKLTLQALPASLWQRHHVRLAVQFGSTIRDRATALSDVDIGVWFTSDGDFQNRALALTNDIMQTLHENRVDIVALNHASPLLRWEVARTGRVLYEAAHATFHQFQLDAFKRHEDAQRLSAWNRRYVHQRLEAWAHG